MSTDGLTVESLKDDTFTYSQRTEDDTCFPAAQKADTVKDNILSEGALRFGGIYDLHHAGGHQKVGTDDPKFRIRRKGQVASSR